VQDLYHAAKGDPVAIELYRRYGRRMSNNVPPSQHRGFMFKQIVVGTDGSETAGKAVREAARLASESGAGLQIVSAYGPAMREDLERLRHREGGVTPVLKEALAQAQEVDVEAEVHELAGDPADAIVKFATDKGNDLIVVGNKGLGGVKGFLLGSVPSKVLTHAPCSVLVVRTVET
jgi:nucleotide-binding universal stress UspA family protein